MTTPRRTHGYMNLYWDSRTKAPHGSAVHPTRKKARESAWGETFLRTVRVKWPTPEEVAAMPAD